MTIVVKEDIGLRLKENPYNLDINDWFTMAKRINKKRSFLFVSKRLGKHLEVKSHKILYGAMLLAKRLNEVFVHAEDSFNWDLPEKQFVDTHLFDYYQNSKQMVFIGFAETATGLGQSVFDRFDNSLYFHTTREELSEKTSVLNFEEEHSHATSHKCYIDEEFINNDLPVVLVDDEVTTGNTSLNIIKNIQKKFPRREYVVVSFLNWMTDEEISNYKRFEREENVKIHFVYLLKGTFNRNLQEALGDSDILSSTTHRATIHPYLSPSFEKIQKGYIKETGRFGLTSKEQREWKKRIASEIKTTDENLLVVGNGELMYIPIFLAYLLGDKKVKSTTRSPIHVSREKDYSIQSGITFQSVDGRDIPYYLYNLDLSTYDRALFITEGKCVPSLVQDFVNKLTSFKTINKVSVLSI